MSSNRGDKSEAGDEPIEDGSASERNNEDDSSEYEAFIGEALDQIDVFIGEEMRWLVEHIRTNYGAAANVEGSNEEIDQDLAFLILAEIVAPLQRVAPDFSPEILLGYVNARIRSGRHIAEILQMVEEVRGLPICNYTKAENGGKNRPLIGIYAKTLQKLTKLFLQQIKLAFSDKASAKDEVSYQIRGKILNGNKYTYIFSCHFDSEDYVERAAKRQKRDGDDPNPGGGSGQGSGLARS